MEAGLSEADVKATKLTANVMENGITSLVGSNLVTTLLIGGSIS